MKVWKPKQEDLAITVIVLGTIYTLFFTSNRTLTSAEINSILQDESQIIENKILKIGEEAEGLVSIISNGNEYLNTNYNDFDTTLNNKISVTSLKFKSGAYENTVDQIQYEGTNLSINGNLISSNVSDFMVRPLDINMVHENEGSFEKTTGLEFTIKLVKKKGYTEIEYPLTIIVKFRNQ